MKALSKMTSSEKTAVIKELRKQDEAHWELWKLAEDLLEIKEDLMDNLGRIEVLVGGYFSDKLK